MKHSQPIPDSSARGTRSSQMIQCLRQNLLYSDKRMRDILFRAARYIIDSRTDTQTSVMLSRLTRELQALGRRWGAHEEIGAQNWDMPAKAVVNNMVRAGVLLDLHGTPIPAGVGAHAAAIAGILDGFEETCEAFLVGFLIRKLGDVTVRDHIALAHALLRRFDPTFLIDDLEDHVVILIARLEGSVALTEDGLYVPVEARPSEAATA